MYVFHEKFLGIKMISAMITDMIADIRTDAADKSFIFLILSSF